MDGMDEWQRCYNEVIARNPECLNPLLRQSPIMAADEAACRLDGMFRDLFNHEERLDLIVTIIRAATTVALAKSMAPTPALPSKARE